MRSSELIGVVVVAATLSILSGVQAQEHGAAAEALFREGIELARAEKYPEAIGKFKASFAIDPARGTLHALALAQEKSGKLAAAFATYQDLAALSRKAHDAERQAAAEARIAALQPRLSALIVVADTPLPPGTRILIDNEPFPPEALGTRIPMDPGHHSLSARSPEGFLFAASAELEAEKAATVRINLVLPASSAPDRPAPAATLRPTRSGAGLRLAGIVTAGAGIVSLGVATYLWVHAGKLHDEVEEACPYNVCSEDQKGSMDRARTEETWATVLWVAGGLGLAGGLTMALLAPRSPRSNSATPSSVRLVVQGASLGVAGTF